MANQYFEGTLQLRNVDKKVVQWVKKQIEKRKDIWIAKQGKVKGGWDLYISSWRYLLALGKELQKKYGGELKKSRKLYSVNKQTSKELYRVTVMFKMHKQKTGDVINYKGEKYKITKLGNTIQAKNINTGKRKMSDHEYSTKSDEWSEALSAMCLPAYF